MAKILVNYIHNKAKGEYEILIDSKYVFADMPVAILETESDINVPLVVPIQGAMTVVDKARYELTNKKFKLVSDENGNVFENENGVEIWLPKDTDVTKLRYINNQLVLIDDEQKQESKEEPQNKKKSKKN